MIGAIIQLGYPRSWFTASCLHRFGQMVRNTAITDSELMDICRAVKCHSRGRQLLLLGQDAVIREQRFSSS